MILLLLCSATNVGIIEKNVGEMKLLQKMVFSTPSRSEREKLQAKLNDLIDINKSLGRKVQKTVKEEQQKINKLESKSSGLSSKDWSELNIRKIQISTHSKRFLEIWTEYNNIQVWYR